MLSLPDELLDVSPRSSILDTLDYLGVVDGGGEEDPELELDSSMMIVDPGRSSLGDLA